MIAKLSKKVNGIIIKTSDKEMYTFKVRLPNCKCVKINPFLNDGPIRWQCFIIWIDFYILQQWQLFNDSDI